MVIILHGNESIHRVTDIVSYPKYKYQLPTQQKKKLEITYQSENAHFHQSGTYFQVIKEHF